jgi:hypothetical protein
VRERGRQCKRRRRTCGLRFLSSWRRLHCSCCGRPAPRSNHRCRGR